MFLTSGQHYVQLFLEWINLAKVLFHSPESKVIDFSFRGNQDENSEFICICEARLLCIFFNQKQRWDEVLFKYMTQKGPEVLTPNSSSDLSFPPINSVLLFLKFSWQICFSSWVLTCSPYLGTYLSFSKVCVYSVFFFF